MFIANRILKQRLQNVYFLWGRGKTTIAALLLDYEAVAPIASHAVYLCNRSSSFDWFNRPDHAEALDAIRRRTDLSDDEKQEKPSDVVKEITNEIL